MASHLNVESVPNCCCCCGWSDLAEVKEEEEEPQRLLMFLFIYLFFSISGRRFLRRSRHSGSTSRILSLGETTRDSFGWGGAVLGRNLASV